MLSLKKIEWPKCFLKAFPSRFRNRVSDLIRSKFRGYEEKEKVPLSNGGPFSSYPLNFAPFNLKKRDFREEMEMPSQYYFSLYKNSDLDIGDIFNLGLGTFCQNQPLPSPHTHKMLPTLNFGMNKDPPPPFLEHVPELGIFLSVLYPLVIYLFMFYCYIYNISGQK